MKPRTSVSAIRAWVSPFACVLLPTLALTVGCGGNAFSSGDGSAGTAGSSNAGSSNAGSSNAGSSNAGSSNAGSSNAGAPSVGGNPGAGSSAGGSTGASCVIGGKPYPSGTGGILAPDGCNHCSCLDGLAACTLLACPPSPKPCGGLAAVACDKGEYCKYPSSAACGAGDQSGECTTIPGGGCLANYAPVCGCDGKEYGNECTAQNAGVSVAHTGACDVAPPGSCSVTVDGVSYPDGATNIPAGDGCNVCSCAKGTLICTKRPCKAPTPCGGFAGNTCAAGEYCAYTPGGLCGQADASSSCKPRPTECSALSQPVCGCDGMGYLNTCSAALAGTGVLQMGSCAAMRRSCVVGDVAYPDGTGNIPASDGCNTCGCSDGSLACTKKACL